MSCCNTKYNTFLYIIQDLTYSGLIAFHYNNGYQILSEDVKIKNTDNASSLIPVLLSHFLPQSELVATQAETSSSYIVLTQGGSEHNCVINYLTLCACMCVVLPLYHFIHYIMHVDIHVHTVTYPHMHTHYVKSLYMYLDLSSWTTDPFSLHNVFIYLNSVI